MDEAFTQWGHAAAIALPFRHMTALVTKHASGGADDPGDVRRIFSSVPSAYPVGGWKHLSGSEWSAHVLQAQRVLVASGSSALVRYFPDHALLRSLGTRTLVNIPLVVCQRTVGALALLCEQERIDPAALARIEALAPYTAPLFVLSQADAG
ncbi:GAF domain-containing protein [Cupriavidus sp. 8B]